MQNFTADSVILQVTFMFCVVKLSTNYITDNADCLTTKFVLRLELKRIIKLK